MFGVPELDAKIGGGLQPGELDLIAGYTSSGKTSLCVQAAWYAAVVQGFNVIYATTETLRAQVRRKIISRHSKLDIFELPEGLNSRDLKNGTLPDHLEDKLQDVVADFTRNPNYGKINVIQLPRGSTVSTIEGRALRISRAMPVSLLVMDYAQLLKAERSRADVRQEQGSIVKDLKEFGVTFDDGRGTVVLSPWQVNRSSRDNAERAGYYTTASLSETAEASNSPDVIISLLEPQENDSRYAELKAQILKNRDGETSSSITIEADYATSYFSSKRRGATMNDLLGEDDDPLGGF